LGTQAHTAPQTAWQTTGLVNYLATVGKDKCGVDTEIRLNRVPFRIEYRQGIDVAHSEPELARLGVKIHSLSFLHMDTTQIDDPLVVDVDPHIVIPLEGKYLTAVVGERGVDFSREAKIVVLALVAETLSVKWEVR
jgi:hypothetical protein